MANRPSRLVVGIPTASADGKYYGRYPHGDASAALAGVVSVVSTMLGTLAATTGALTHGQTLVINGSGFGSKYLSAPVFDDCTGVSPTLIWNDAVLPSADAGEGNTWHQAYRTAPFIVPAGTSPVGPQGFSWEHPNVIATGVRARGTKIVAGGSFGNSLNTQWNNVLSRTFTAPAYPYFTILRWWEGLDATYPDNQRNFKLFDFAMNSFFEGSANWYIDYQNGSTTSTSAPQYEINSDGLGLSGAGAGWGTGSGHFFPGTGAMHSPRNAWVLREVHILHASAGVVYVVDENQAGTRLIPIDTTNVAKTTSLSTIDGWGGSLRAMGPIGYNDPPSSATAGSAYGCWRPRADIFMDVDTNKGYEFYLTNSASWATSTSGGGNYAEIQNWTLWTDPQVNITVNGGRLTGGGAPIFLHLRQPPFVTGQSDTALATFALN